ncbi:MAG TPA: hypothetical protein ENJ00_07460, partial [Phycisphaerales bacterium]|nr:hypothetical protein [Phycisphaerales bacterium]
MRQTIDLIEEMYAKAGKLDSKLTDELNQAGDPGGVSGQVPYEGTDATFRDAINTLRDKLDSNMMRVDTRRRNGARTRNKSGVDGDVVLIAGGQLQRMCASGNDGSRFFTKIRLGASLANEMVHVYQIFAGVDLRQCDAERDSDTATLIFVCQMADIVAAANSPADISAQDCPKLKACLTAYGVDAGSEWSVLETNMPKYKEYYEKRRKEKFDDVIQLALSWGKAYYKDSNWAGPINFAEVTGPESVRLTAPNGTERFYNLPVGKKILSRDVTRNDAGQIVLTVVAQDVNTKVICTFVFTDTDGDTLPEPTPQVSQAQTPSNNAMDNDDLFALPFIPGDVNDVQSGWTYVDTTDGTVYILPIDPLTMAPLGPFFDFVFVDPLLSDLNGFIYLDAVLPGGTPDQELWLFTSTPPVMGYGDQPAVLFEIDLLSGLWNPVFNGSIATSLIPTNLPGILRLDVGLTQIELAGLPGGDATILDIGQGPGFPVLPPAPIGLDGLSGPLLLPPLPAGLFELQTQALTLQDSVVLFQPPLGENIACVENDETGNGASDRILLTVDPPRLHFFEGIPGDPLGSAQHVFELVLESDQ